VNINKKEYKMGHADNGWKAYVELREGYFQYVTIPGADSAQTAMIQAKAQYGDTKVRGVAPK
jgi:hypothetical protein